MWRGLASNALGLLIVGLVAFAAAVSWAEREWRAAGPLGGAICLEVETGSNMRRVSETLAEQGAISRPALFRAGVGYADLPGLKAGSFLVPEGASMEEIARSITEGGPSTCGTEVVFRIGVTASDVLVRALDPETGAFERVAEFDAGGELPPEYGEVADRADTRFRVTVAEGVTSWQVAEGLRAAPFLAGDIPEVPAEGTLAPDSYEVRVGTDRGELLAAMAASQSEILAAAWEARDPSVPLQSPEEALILASIVEKETGLPEERQEVAGVFVNRLREGMRLQTDPTVIYGVTRGEGVLGRGLRRSELDRETPWNTYLIDGLPPTPIANPGAASILAATDPGSTDNLFFVADGTGGHAFAATLAEHNENVARWREIEAQAAGQ